MKPTSDYIAPRLAGVAEALAWHVRRQIFERTMRMLKPKPDWRVIDVGVTHDQSHDSNFFEKLYPYPEKITAVGRENAEFLEQQYPGLSFVRADATALPFPDNAFDLAFCSAVIEHVGARPNQRKVISELVRVSRVAVLTTPNRYYPLEFHTLTPLLHWLPPRLFRRFLRLTGRNFFAKESSLNLLSHRDMRRIFRDCEVNAEACHHRLGGAFSNLVYILTKAQK